MSYEIYYHNQIVYARSTALLNDVIGRTASPYKSIGQYNIIIMLRNKC